MKIRRAASSSTTSCQFDDRLTSLCIRTLVFHDDDGICLISLGLPVDVSTACLIPDNL